MSQKLYFIVNAYDDRTLSPYNTWARQGLGSQTLSEAEERLSVYLNLYPDDASLVGIALLPSTHQSTPPSNHLNNHL